MKKKSYAVIGMGRFGASVATELFKLGHEVLVIDEHDDIIQKYADQVTNAVAGDATDEAVLRAIGIKNFDCTIVALADIESSAVIALTLKNMGIPEIICKAKNALHATLLQKIGVDQVVLPEREMGLRLAHNLASKNVIDYIELSGTHSIAETKVPAGWVGKTIREQDVRAKFGVSIIAIRKHDSDAVTVSPGADYRFTDKDYLVVVGSNDDIQGLQDQ